MMLILYHQFDRQIDSSQFTFLMNPLPIQMAESVLRFKRWQDRQASLIGKLMIIYGLNKLGYKGNPLEQIKYSKYGKPYIEDQLNFNISHSHHMVICVFSAHKIGTDVESTKQKIKFDDFNQFFSNKEWQNILQSDDQRNRFFEYWCKKESVIKADGRGFSAPLKQLILNHNHAILDHKKYYLQEIQIAPNYKTYIALDAPFPHFEIQYFDFF